MFNRAADSRIRQQLAQDGAAVGRTREGGDGGEVEED